MDILDDLILMTDHADRLETMMRSVSRLFDEDLLDADRLVRELREQTVRTARESGIMITPNPSLTHRGEGDFS